MTPLMLVWGGPVVVTMVPAHDSGSHGISGLAQAPDGGLWAVSERSKPRLLALSEEGAVRAKHRVARVPWGMDLESVDWLDEDTLLLGTEHPIRGRASVLLAEWDGHRARVVREWEAGHGGLPDDIDRNSGFEGLCVGEDIIALGLEMRTTVADGYAAPIYIVSRAGLDWHRPTVAQTILLPLPEHASLSALHCGPGGQLSVLARGRNSQGVWRYLMRHTLGEDRVEVFDLGEELAPHNVEGLIEADGGWWLITDARPGGATWLRVTLP